MTAGPATVLVLRALGLGDLLTGIPALRGMRGAYPSARIVLAMPKPLAPLAMFCGAVDEVLPAAGLGDLRWPGPPPDVAVNLHGRGPESIADLLSTKPKTLISQSNPKYPEVGGPPWRDEIHQVYRWCLLPGGAGIICGPHDLSLGRPSGYPRCDDVVVIHPGVCLAAKGIATLCVDSDPDRVAQLHRGRAVIDEPHPGRETMRPER